MPEKKPLPSALEPKGLPKNRLDLAVEKFGGVLGDKDGAVNIKGRIYEAYLAEESGPEHEEILRKMESIIGGRILSVMILGEMQHSVDVTLQEADSSFHGFKDLKDFIAHLKRVGTLEKFIPTVTRTDTETIRAGLLEMFEEGIKTALVSSSYGEVFKPLLNSKLNEVVVRAFQKSGDAEDDLPQVVEDIIDAIEDVGNLLFKGILQETKL